MSAAVMMEQIAGSSPRLKARIAGALWLIIIVAAAFAEFYVRGRIVVDGDAAATATNILAHETLYRLGAAAALIYLLCDTAVAPILYELFKPVSRSLSLLASFFSPLARWRATVVSKRILTKEGYANSVTGQILKEKRRADRGSARNRQL